MGPLSANDMITIWETAQDQPPLDRALTLLCRRVRRRGAAGNWPGRRSDRGDRQLLDLFELTFGRQLDCQGICPGCGQGLEYALSVEDLRLPPTSEPSEEGGIYRFVTPEATIRLRLPNSDDLTATGNVPPLGRRAFLLERCILEARVEGDGICRRGARGWPPHAGQELSGTRAGRRERCGWA